MKTYIVGDIEVEARDAPHLIEQMAATSMAPSETAEAWMEDAAARYHMVSGVDVRTDTAEHFVQDLIDFKMITVKE